VIIADYGSSAIEATFQLISSDCKNGKEILTAVIDTIKSGSVPIVAGCDAMKNLPYSWIINWEEAVIFVHNDLLQVRIGNMVTC